MSGSSKNNPQAKRTEEDSENGGVGLRDGLNGSTNCPPCADRDSFANLLDAGIEQVDEVIGMNDDGHLDDVDLKSSSDAGSVEEAMQVGVVLEHVADNANAVYDMELTNVAPVDDGNGLPDDAEPATPVAEDRHAAAAADAAVGGPTGQHHGHCYHCSYAGVDCFGAIPTPAMLGAAMTRMIFEKIRGPETTRLTVEPVGPAPVEKME